jgi:hypothetical protein
VLRDEEDAVDPQALHCETHARCPVVVVQVLGSAALRAVVRSTAPVMVVHPSRSRSTPDEVEQRSTGVPR